MATRIRVKRKDLIAKLASVKEDNIGIGGVAIDRGKLLQALKLQTSAAITLTYGKVSYGDTNYYNKAAVGNYTVDNEPCIQFSCNHTVMRFLNRPKSRNGQDPTIRRLNLTTSDAVNELNGIPIDPQELIRALSLVLPCVAIEQTRPVLNCILFDSGDDAIRLVAADGFRLGIDKVNADCVHAEQVLIDKADIAKLLTFLKAIKPTGKGRAKAYPQVYLYYDYQAIKFATTDGHIELPKQSGTFPDYQKLIPDSGTHIMVVASEMLESVKALKAVAKEGSGIIRLSFEKYPDRVTLSASGDDHGSRVECQAIVDKPCYVAVSAKYLSDLLSPCKDRVIDLFVDKPSSPVLCHDGLDHLQLTMPMFVQW